MPKNDPLTPAARAQSMLQRLAAAEGLGQAPTQAQPLLGPLPSSALAAGYGVSALASPGLLRTLRQQQLTQSATQERLIEQARGRLEREDGQLPPADSAEEARLVAQLVANGVISSASAMSILGLTSSEPEAAEPVRPAGLRVRNDSGRTLQAGDVVTVNGEEVGVAAPSPAVDPGFFNSALGIPYSPPYSPPIEYSAEHVEANAADEAASAMQDLLDGIASSLRAGPSGPPAAPLAKPTKPVKPKVKTIDVPVTAVAPKKTKRRRVIRDSDIKKPEAPVPADDPLRDPVRLCIELTKRLKARKDIRVEAKVTMSAYVIRTCDAEGRQIANAGITGPQIRSWLEAATPENLLSYLVCIFTSRDLTGIRLNSI